MEDVMKTLWSESEEIFDEGKNQDSVLSNDYTKDDEKAAVDTELDNLEKIENDDKLANMD